MERSEDDEENDAYRQIIRRELAAVAQWATWRAEEDAAFRRKVALARTRKAELTRH
jgi:hypothetical protein